MRDFGVTIVAFFPCFKLLVLSYFQGCTLKSHERNVSKVLPDQGAPDGEHGRSKFPTAVVLVVALSTRSTLECHLLLFAGI